MNKKLMLSAGAIAIILMVAAVAGCSGNQSTVTPEPVTVTPTAGATLIVTPSATPTVVPSVTPAVTRVPTQAPTPVPDQIVRTYQWPYKDRIYTWQLSIPQPYYDHFKSLPHDSAADYAAYALSDTDRPYLQSLPDKLSGVSQSEGYGEYDTAMLVAAFVQSLPNNAGAGFDDYARYPAETLVDGGGDSEDTSILAAALLNDLGYDSIVLGFDGHRAVGVRCPDDTQGRYYTYDGARYYYLETSIPGYGLGSIPDQYKQMQATVYPLKGVPVIELSCSKEVASSDDLYVYYKVSCSISNTGAGTAKNGSIYFAALALIYGPDQVWEPTYDVSIGDMAEGQSRTFEETLKIPRSGATQIECIASGDNFGPVSAKTEQFSV